MNRPEAEQLLGGYATGTLTDSEKQVLFAAALEHQELFDALMDEEALRELLADPEVRKRLLAVLPLAEERKLQQRWRKPAFIGLAASLFALVTTSVLILQSPKYRSLPAVPSAASAPRGIADAVTQDKVAPALSSPTPPKPASPPKAKSAELPGRAIKAEAGISTAAAKASENSSRALAKEARKDADVEEASPKWAMPPEPSFLAESDGGMAADAQVAQGAKRVKGSLQADAGHSEEGLPPFASTLDHLPGGQVRLKVIWGPHGHLYVLKRTPKGSAVLSAQAVTAGKQGMRTTSFELALGERDALDVYVLIEAIADPGSLPATGAIRGERRRVYPE